MNERLTTLFQKQLRQDISPGEKLELYELMADQSNSTQIHALLQDHWDDFDGDLLTPTFAPGQSEELLANLMATHIYPPKAEVKRLSSWRLPAVAAAILIAVLGLVFYFNQTGEHPGLGTGIAKNEITPGHRGATLTLADGRRIKLSSAANGKLANEAGVVITKAADGRLVYEIKDSKNNQAQINRLSTAKGETYEVRLPDGSLVVLNAASSLTYATNLLKGGKRKVELDGEGYFEIAKDKEHPFIVQSRGQEVEVLGTHFNVNTYADEPVIATTLLEGSVQITSGKLKTKIKPGEQAIYDGADFKVRPANIEQVMGWTKGDFYLNHVNFKIAMRDIARWYDIEVYYDTKVPNDMEAGGWISRSNLLSTVLKSIESSELVKFRIEGRKIYVTK